MGWRCGGGGDGCGDVGMIGWRCGGGGDGCGDVGVEVMVVMVGDVGGDVGHGSYGGPMNIPR